MKYHYKLYRIGDNRNPISAFFCMIKNIAKVFKKKKKYVINEGVK